MAGYIGSKASVTQVDGYNRTEADNEFVQVTGDTMTGDLSVTGTFHVTGDALFEGTSGTVNTAIVDHIDQRLVLGSYYEGGVGQYSYISSTNNNMTGNLSLVFRTGNTERMRIDSGGKVLVGRTTAYSDGTIGTPALQVNAVTGAFAGLSVIATATSGTAGIGFVNPNGSIGNISLSGSSTAYNTSSDYRLKTDAQPMTGASARVQALNPVNFEWIADGSRVDGFLAHEAQEVVPEAVTGTKDAVDVDGSPEYQGIDQGKLVPLLTAALQEALTKIDELETRITALETP